MRNNTAWALVICTAIASCTAVVVSKNVATSKLTPLERCVNNTMTSAGIDDCIKAFGTKQ